MIGVRVGPDSDPEAGWIILEMTYDPDAEPFDSWLAANLQSLPRKVIVDTRQGPVPNLAQLREFESLLNNNADHLGGSKWAVWTSSDVMFGMARTHEAINADHAHVVRAFRSLADARRWLGIKV